MKTNISAQRGMQDIQTSNYVMGGSHIGLENRRHTGLGISCGADTRRMITHCATRYVCGCGRYTCKQAEIVHQWSDHHLQWLKRTHEQKNSIDWVDSVINDEYVWDTTLGS